jgi:hypothetical protein
MTWTSPRDTENPPVRRVFDKGEGAILTQPTLIDSDQPVLRILLLMLPL